MLDQKKDKAKPLEHMQDLQERKMKNKPQVYEAAAASSLKIGILKVARLSAWTLVIIFVHSI